MIGSNFFDGWVYQGGAFQLGFNLFWVQIMAGRGKRARLQEQYEHLPLGEAPLIAQSPGGRFYREWLEHPVLDDYWRSVSIDSSYRDVRVPALNIGGWYDLFLGGTLENFARMRREAGSARAREHTRLLVGPWAHGSTYGAYPDHGFEAFAPEDRVDLQGAQLQFLGDELFDREPASPHAPVRIFVMGANRWRDEPDWPLSRAVQERWFLHGEGDGGGELSPRGASRGRAARALHVRSP